MKDDSQDNVVEGEFGKPSEMKVEYLPQSRISDRRYKNAECKHNKVWLDEDNHCLECQSCGRVVDPIKYLQRFANYEREIDHRVRMIKEFQRREAAAVERERRRHMPREDWKKPSAEIHTEHRANGCPKEFMWFTRTMIKCYCGIGRSRTYNKQLESEVRSARKASEKRWRMKLAV